MHVVESPPLPPGACALTGTSVGPFVDTLIDDDAIRPGRVYLAASTVTSMASLLGMVSELAHSRLKSRVQRLEDELAETRSKLLAQVELNQALINAGYKEPSHAS